MKQVQAAVLAFLFLVMAAAVGSLHFYDGQRPEPQTQKPSLEKSFEILLNDMLQDVQRELRAYKDQRKILADMVKPENLRDPSYVEENYRMMQELGPRLRLQMQSVMDIFNRADRNVSALLENEPDIKRQDILENWKNLKTLYVVPYMDYFRIETEILTVYEDLMTFYFVHAGDFRFDSQSFSLLYDKETDRLRSENLLARIAQLSEMQASVLQ
jgi:hypothetical protein